MEVTEGRQGSPCSVDAEQSEVDEWMNEGIEAGHHRASLPCPPPRRVRPDGSDSGRRGQSRPLSRTFYPFFIPFYPSLSPLLDPVPPTPQPLPLPPAPRAGPAPSGPPPSLAQPPARGAASPPISAGRGPRGEARRALIGGRRGQWAGGCAAAGACFRKTWPPPPVPLPLPPPSPPP